MTDNGFRIKNKQICGNSDKTEENKFHSKAVMSANSNAINTVTATSQLNILRENNDTNQILIMSFTCETMTEQHIS